MAGERWLCVAVVAVLALGGAAARADIINGGFSNAALDGSAGWLAVVHPHNNASLALADANSGMLHVVTSNTYNWDGNSSQWVPQEIAPSAVLVTQDVPADGSGFFAPPGTTALEFYANISILSNPAGNTGAGIVFQVNYNGSYATTSATPLGNTAATIRVEMPGLVPNVPVMDFSLASFSMLDMAPDPNDGTSYTITVDAKFDNFKFVPEPMSACLLLAGAAGIVLRRRRRTA